MKRQFTHHLTAALLGVVFTAELHAQTSAFACQRRRTWQVRNILDRLKLVAGRLRCLRPTLMAAFLLVQLCAAPFSFGAVIGWTAETDEPEWNAQSGPVGGPFVNNWTGGIPGSSDEVLFDDRYLLNPLRTVDLNGNRSVQSLSLYGNITNSTFSDYTLDTTVGANTLTLGNGANGTGTSLDSRYGNHIFNCNLLLNDTTAGNLCDCHVGNGTLTINGVVTGNDNLYVRGAGTLILVEANSYSGGTAVSSSGTLQVANTTGSATGTGGVIVTNGGTLKGTGRISGAITIGSDGTISPGDSVGTLTALSSLTLSGTYHCELNQNNSDRIAVTGVLDITGATLDVTELVRAEASTNTIATFGTLVSTFSHVTGLNPHYSVQYTPTAIILVRESVLWHVTANATTNDINGKSWATPANLQLALTYADPGEEIWVKAGVYYPDTGTGQTNNDRTATFQLPPGVALLGGFAGTETNADQHDPDANLTVLSGDIDQNDPSTGGVVLTADDVGASNAYTVVTMIIPANAGQGSQTRLDGFTITGGRSDLTNPASQADYPKSFGGGIYVAVTQPAETPVIERCRSIGNYAWLGGGLFTYKSRCNVIASRFRGNEAMDGGGAYYWQGNIATTNCLFAGNYADDEGGGIFNYLCTLNIVGSTFSGNISVTNGGAVFNQLFGNAVTFANTILWNNSTRGATTLPDASVANRTDTTYSYSLIHNINTVGPGNLNGTVPANDPLFVAPIPIGAGPTSDGNLRLQPGSPVIDAGDQSLNLQSTDLDALSRVVGDDMDMGAYEFRTFPLSIASLGNAAFVTWPGSAALPLQLERTSDLINGPWVSVTNTPVFDINSHIWSSTIGIAPGQTQEFFRLVP